MLNLLQFHDLSWDDAKGIINEDFDHIEAAVNQFAAETIDSSTGVAGNEAAHPIEGSLYFPNNGFVVRRSDGTTWNAWGPLFPLNDIASAPTAWVNQGSAILSTSHGGIFIEGPAGSGPSLRIRDKAAPATPYTITACFLGRCMNTQRIGIGFRASSSGKLATIEVLSAASYAVSKWTDATTFSATYITSVAGQIGTLVWLRIADNGTSRISSISSDGVHFIPLHTVGRTDFLTADRVCFWVSDSSNLYPVGMTLLSWKET